MRPRRSAQETNLPFSRGGGLLDRPTSPRDFLTSHPMRAASLALFLCFSALMVLYGSKKASLELSNDVAQGQMMNALSDPESIVESALGSRRAEVLDEAEKIQGFSDAYPTYELNDEVAVVAMTDVEAEELESKVEKVVEEELKEEAEDGSRSVIRYADQKEYDAAPFIKVPVAKPMKQSLWWALKAYESYYSKYPIKWYIPRLDPSVQLTPELFHEHYRRHAAPVIINGESLRHLGFRTRPWTFSELRKAFPYNETKAFNIVKDYKANAVRRDDEEIDLGPGLASIVRDEKLAKQGNLRNYPRNLHVKREALAKLQVDYPPLLSGGAATWQLPTLWLGTTTADTPFHHDCCDNFVLMIAGVKRFTLAPPTDWRTLNPICTGPNKSLCWAKVSDPNKPNLTKKSQEIMDNVHKIIVDLQPGEILYMPAGWWHHVKNVGPTVMVNFWTTKAQMIGLVKVLKETA